MSRRTVWMSGRSPIEIDATRWQVKSRRVLEERWHVYTLEVLQRGTTFLVAGMQQSELGNFVGAGYFCMGSLSELLSYVSLVAAEIDWPEGAAAVLSDL